MLINKTRDKHLNLFRLYNASERVENNLTRALAMFLQNDALFFKEFLTTIVPNNHFDHVEEGYLALIDIQVETKLLNEESTEKVWGVTLTTDNIPDVYFELEPPAVSEGRNVTDLIIRLKETLIVIEVKRTNEHCVEQLKLQLSSVKDKVAGYKSLTWENVMEVIRRTRNTYALIGQQSPILEDFRNLIASEYAHWLPSQPFKYIETSNPNKAGLKELLHKRLESAKRCIKDYKVEYTNNRSYIAVNWGWASEVIPEFFELSNPTLCVQVWPGNTKGQGWHIFNNRSQAWQDKKELHVAEFGMFPLRIWPQIKFSSTFGAFISEINIEEPELNLKKPIHTNDNFKNSGRWTREGFPFSWNELEPFFDFHFSSDFDWRKACGWEENFLNTGRNALTVAFGFIVQVAIPYEMLQKIDKDESGVHHVAKLLTNITNALEGVLDV